MEVIKRALLISDYSPKAKEFVLELLRFTLTRNYFRFENDFYLQRRGTAMGANVALTFANIFMAALEEETIYTSHYFRKVLRWWRYIDDIFLLWAGTTEELEDFHGYLNTVNHTVKFTLTYSIDKMYRCS